VPELIDDVSIGDDERLLHRIRVEDIFIDPQTGQRRPSSATFRSKSNIISVDLASLTTPVQALAAYPQHALLGLFVLLVARSCAILCLTIFPMLCCMEAGRMGV